MNKRDVRVDFDDYADDYEEMLQKQLAFFNTDRSYFSAYKTDIAAKLCKNKPDRIIDFGCGIGLSLPHLIQRFPNAQIHASDLSEKSLDHIRHTYSTVKVLSDHEVDGETFDLIFVTGVFHHIPAAQRPTVVKRLSRLLTERGMLCVFEHNPFNPVTRHMVSTCPFDADAELITLKGMRSLITSTGLRMSDSGYCLFFPQALQRLRPLEKMLPWLPLGGQYFVTATK
jgi:trans-aconitate methyltransferase